MKWEAKFIGRKFGDIGKTYSLRLMVEADDVESVRAAIYEAGYEHVDNLRLQRVGLAPESVDERLNPALTIQKRAIS